MKSIYYGKEDEEGRTVIAIAESQTEADKLICDYFGINNAGDDEDVGWVSWKLCDTGKSQCVEITD